MKPDRSLFALIAPRLERAHRERRQEIADAFAERRFVRGHVLDMERLVAHRELQLVRAGATGDGRYISVRAAKLTTARAKLTAAQRWAERIGA